METNLQQRIASSLLRALLKEEGDTLGEVYQSIFLHLEDKLSIESPWPNFNLTDNLKKIKTSIWGI